MSTWKRYKKNRIALVSLIIILAMFVIAISSDLIAPYGPFTTVAKPQQPPSLEHLFGTDKLGRDVFSRVLYGSRISLIIGLGATAITTLIGIGVGVLAGYYKRLGEYFILRFSEVFLMIPSFFLFIIFVSTLKDRSPLIILTMIGITMWPRLARIIRGEFLYITQLDYVTAARGLGVKDRVIMLRHILPNIMPPIIVVSTMNIAEAILVSAGLDFLGLGDPTACSWGTILTGGRDVLLYSWWITTFAGLALFITCLAFNLVGDGLRDSLDPRLKGAVLR